MKSVKRMICICTALAAMTGFGTMALAEEAKPAGEAMAKPAEKKAKKAGKSYSSKESFERFSKKLNLSKEQKEAIRPIMNEEVKRISDLYKEVREKELQVIEEYRGKIREQLKPEQQGKYDQMMDRKVKKFQEMMKKKGLQEEQK